MKKARVGRIRGGQERSSQLIHDPEDLMVIILFTCKTERIVRVRTTSTQSHMEPRSDSKKKRIDVD